MHFALTQRIKYLPVLIFGACGAILNHFLTAHFSFCLFLLRKVEPRFEALTEPNLGGSHKKVQNRSALDFAPASSKEFLDI